ncbi:tyrosine-type recombinase/integrase [Granulicella sp. L46]|uniref:tyrosine-type recombinase/integrase n=1 Tax=Granulicella sp. L46 TaxID=1641865 RepID=UPI00131B97AC|nr:tyrosine-type recombinase/integrase [Granulicella sp. L46]
MTLSLAIDQYLVWKRANGYKCWKVEGVLRQMVKHLGNIEVADMTPDQMLSCLNRISIANSTWVGKYWMYRRFFEHWLARGVIRTFEMPPPRVNPRRTFVPHVFTTPEIRSLLDATKRNRRWDYVVDQPTLRTIVVLLYATGLPVGEIPTILESDLDLDGGFLHIRSEQPHRNRRIPIGSDLCGVLREYKAIRAEPNAGGPYLFLTRRGKPPTSARISISFRALRLASGVRRRVGSRHQPCISDLRFTFAVHRISAGIENGDDLNRLLPALAAYMGQVGLGSTARYLALAPERFRKDLDKLSPRGESGHWKDDPELVRFLENL